MRPLLPLSLSCLFVLTAVAPALGASVDLPVVGQALPVVNGEFEVSTEAARPAVCLVAGPGYINVFEPGNALGLPWLVSVSPCNAGVMKAVHWSSSAATEFGDWDGDGDREARISPGVQDPVVGANHNLWQAYPSPHQAFTADFGSLQFRVEAGTIPRNAAIILSLSETPLSDVTPWVPFYIDCQLAFRGDQLQPDADGNVALNPAEGQFASRWEGCNDEKAAWDAAQSEAERRAVLDKLRIVQHSYWNFNGGTAPVVIDGVRIDGARTVVDAALGL